MQSAKTVARRFFHHRERGELDDAASLIAQDATWWVLGTGTLDKAAIGQVYAGLIGGTETRAMKIIGEIAEDDRVAVEIEGQFRFKDGRVLKNAFHVALTVVDGRIRSAREYMDTAALQAFLKPPP